MALDSKQKRGSVIGLSLPFRVWQAEPDGTLESGDRMSIMGYSSAISATALVVFDLICFTLQTFSSPSFTDSFESPDFTDTFSSPSFTDDFLECD